MKLAKLPTPSVEVTVQRGVLIRFEPPTDVSPRTWLSSILAAPGRQLASKALIGELQRHRDFPRKNVKVSITMTTPWPARVYGALWQMLVPIRYGVSDILCPLGREDQIDWEHGSRSGQYGIEILVTDQ